MIRNKFDPTYSKVSIWALHNQIWAVMNSSILFFFYFFIYEEFIILIFIYSLSKIRVSWIESRLTLFVCYKKLWDLTQF